MAQSEYTKTLNKLQSIVHKELKAQGFVKKGRTHNKVVEEGLVHVVNFQSGEYPIGDKYIIPGIRESLYGQFAVNLGVFVSDIYEVTDKPLDNTFIPEYICQIRVRLAELTKGKDHWWTVGENYMDVANEIINGLNKQAADWFFHFSSRQKTIESLQDESIPNLSVRIGKLNAALIQLKSDRQAGERLLREHYHLRSDHKPHQQYVRDLAKKIGIQIG
jgi:hypothetical protein